MRLNLLLVGVLFTCAANRVVAQDVVQSSGAFTGWAMGGVPTGTRAVGFFDGPSDDVPGFPVAPSGPGCGIAYFLIGADTSKCEKWGGPGGTLNPAPMQLPFLAQGSEPATFTFHPACQSLRTITLNLVYAGYHAQNQLGWYLLSNPNVRFPLVGGGTGKSVGHPVSFTPLGDFGYYLLTGEGKLFLSGSHRNFVLFSQDPGTAGLANMTKALLTYWIGAEDKDLPAGSLGTGVLSNGTDADYNDMVVQVSVQPCQNQPPPPPSMSCTLTQGGYKNKFASKITGLTIGGEQYETAEVNSILANNAVKGNGLVSLLHQLVTAKLNVWYNGGTAPTPVLQAIKDADSIIQALAVQTGKAKIALPTSGGYLSPSMTATLAGLLDQYNNGLLPGGPQHCK